MTRVKLLLPRKHLGFEAIWLAVKLLVDGEEIVLNEFAAKILSGTIIGAVGSLRGVGKDWKKIEMEIAK